MPHREGDRWQWCRVSDEMVEQLREGVEVARARISIQEDNVIVVELLEVIDVAEAIP